MHGGEAPGVLAASELIRILGQREIQGRVLIVPILSTRAFFMRSMQLSPVDEREMHYVWPGNPEGSYSEHLVDLLFRTIKSTDCVVDMHSGELVQELTPWIAVPWIEDGPLWDRSFDLATAFNVPIVDRRAVAETPLALPHALLKAGIPNVWTEIGSNGLPMKSSIDLQLNGLVNLLHNMRVLPGPGERFAPRLVGPQHWSVIAEQSGIWRAEVHAGDNVKQGQHLGTLYDVFGNELRRYESPADALVQFLATSPAINVDRQPGGYQWHQWLVQLVEDPTGDVS
jgi:predicted deacylase